MGKRFAFNLLIVASCLWPMVRSVQAQQGTMSPDEFLAWVEASRDKVQTLYVEFKSAAYRMGPQTSNGQREKAFEKNGAWWYTARGDERLEFSETYASEGEETPPQAQSWVKTGEKVTQVAKGSAISSGRVGDAKSWRGRQPGLPERLFLLEDVLAYEDAIRKTFKDEGFHSIGDVRCLKISFDMAAQVPQAPRWTYWIDVQRGQPLQRTLEKDGRLLMILKDVKLAKIGEGTWLPVAGRVQGYLPERSRQTASEEVIEFDPISIKLNEPFPNSTFQVNFEPGTRVVDHVSGKHYFEGGAAQLRTSTPPPTREQLDRALDQADADKRAIEAVSLARSGRWAWAYWLGGLLSVAMLGVAGYLSWQRRAA